MLAYLLNRSIYAPDLYVHATFGIIIKRRTHVLEGFIRFRLPCARRNKECVMLWEGTRPKVYGGLKFTNTPLLRRFTNVYKLMGSFVHVLRSCSRDHVSWSIYNIQISVCRQTIFEVGIHIFVGFTFYHPCLWV